MSSFPADAIRSEFERAKKRKGQRVMIRLCVPAEIPVLIDLFRQSVRRGTVADYSAAQRLAWAPDHIDGDAWAARCANRPTWVAEIAGTVTGFVDLESDGHIDMLFVHPEFHRQGIATALLARVESEAQTQGIKRLFAEVSRTARPVFEKAGFSVIEQQAVIRAAETLTNYRMQKPL